MTPYQQALELIEQHPGCGSTIELSKLVLSLYNGRECPFSFAECVASLDSKNTQLALDMVKHYCDHGEDADLRKVGAKVVTLYPHLWELGRAAWQAKYDLQEWLWSDE